MPSAARGRRRLRWCPRPEPSSRRPRPARPVLRPAIETSYYCEAVSLETVAMKQSKEDAGPSEGRPPDLVLPIRGGLTEWSPCREASALCSSRSSSRSERSEEHTSELQSQSNLV